MFNKTKTIHTTLLSISILAISLIGLLAITKSPVYASDNDFSNGITVDNKGDGADSNVGDNICDDGSGNCTLRAAIEESNATTGAQTINFNITGTADFTNNGQNGYTIQPTSGLPTITDTVTINGYSQPGAQANTAVAPNPLNGTLLIEIDGSSQNDILFKFRTNSNNSAIRGLVLNRTQSNAISIIGATGVVVQGNYVGTDPTGLIARPNGLDNVNSSTAIDIGDFTLMATDTSTVDTLVGGTNPQDRNVVSGNYGGAFGVGAVDSTFYGNYFGLGADGLTTLGNSNGTGVTTGVLTIDYANGVQFGNGQLEGMNVVSGNSRGIQPDYSSNLVFKGNRIGTDYSGTLPRPNLRNGISLGLGTNNVTIGGSNPGDGNLIAYNQINGVETWTSGVQVSNVVIRGNDIHDNTNNGIEIGGASNLNISSNNIYNNSTANHTANIYITGASILGFNTDGVAFSGNKIGLAPDGSIANNNPLAGIYIPGDATNVIIGGPNSGNGNEIAGHGNGGVIAMSGDLQAIPAFVQANKISILSNSIHDNNSVNSGLGIDLVTGVELGMPDGIFNSYNNLGPDTNDSGDTDTGSNNLINFPVINSVDQNNLNLSVNFNLDALDSPTNQYRVEFFANDSADPSGYGEGQTYLGYATVSPGNNQIANITLPAGTNLTGKVLSATTTAIDNTTTSGFGSTSEFSLASNITVSSLPTNNNTDNSNTNNSSNNTTNNQNQSNTNLANTGDNKTIPLMILSVVMIGVAVAMITTRGKLQGIKLNKYRIDT